jgi:AraC-like DNA-binding protein
MTAVANVGEEAATFNQIFIVEFQPAGLHAFLSLKQNELADRHFSFQLLHAKLNQVLMELLEAAESVEELLAGVDRLFVHALLKDCPPELATSRKMIVQQSGNISLKKLSNEVFYSERHLTRLFNEYLGMSTKMFARLVRVNQTIRLLNRRQGVITKVLEPAGYYDFSHFNRDFKLVTGITPQAYQRKMSDFYSEIAKF